jgi:alpha-tubulin suppressor-like RCC1 family protein
VVPSTCPAKGLYTLSDHIHYFRADSLTATARPYSATVVPAQPTYKAISAGGAHTCAITTEGTAACWGASGGGQSAPPSGQFRAASAGQSFTCAIRTDYTVACWGDNSFHQSTPPSGTFKAITAGVAYTCAIRPDDAIACWGYNNLGQVDASQFGRVGRDKRT